METTSSFGYWIRRQRKALDLTQQALADQVGCSLAAIKKIEQDERRPSKQIAERLADILGVPTSQRKAFVEVARGLRSVDQLPLADELRDPTATRSAKAPSTNLPIQLTSFIGRTRETMEARQLLSHTRLLTLTGPGGTGKTRLSLQVAQELLPAFTHGVWWVELASLTDPSLIPQTIASVFKLREVPNIPLIDVLTNYLRTKQLLLILDNCEHLIDACAKLSEGLLSVCSQLKIIATSREALGIRGETVYRVPSLALPDAAHLTPEALMECESVQLFVDRAMAVQSQFVLREQNRSAIAQICQRLDGIPLALELAAARVAVFSVEEIASRLDDRFKLLTLGSRTVLQRHQTLRALIDWSYDLLSEEERRFFRQLSVFAGGWTFEAAEAVCANLDVLRLLTQLVNKSLVLTEEHAEGTRYHLLETIQQYAREKFLESGEVEQTCNRHLDLFLSFAEKAEPKLRGAEQITWLKHLETENDNLRAALAWSLESGRSDHALQLAGALSYFWELGRSREGYKWLDPVLRLVENRQNETVEQAIFRAKALYASGRLHFMASFDPSDGRTKIEESLHIARQMGDRWLITVALEHLGWMAILEGDIETAYAHLEEGTSLARDLEDPWPLALCLLRLASPLMRIDADKATQIAQEGMILARNLGDTELLSYGLIQLAGSYFMMANFVEAALAAEEALERARTIGSGYISMSLFLLAVISSLQGRSAKAENFCSQLCDRARETEYTFAIGIALIALAWVTNHRGQSALSARLLAASETQFHQLGIELNTYGGPILIAYKQALKRAEKQLDPATFKVMMQLGRTLTPDQALALVTEVESKNRDSQR